MDVQKSNIYLGVMNASAVGLASLMVGLLSPCPALGPAMLLILVVWNADGTVRPENTTNYNRRKVLKIVKLRQGSDKDRQGLALKAKCLRA